MALLQQDILDVESERYLNNQNQDTQALIYCTPQTPG